MERNGEKKIVPIRPDVDINKPPELTETAQKRLAELQRIAKAHSFAFGVPIEFSTGIFSPSLFEPSDYNRDDSEASLLAHYLQESYEPFVKAVEFFQSTKIQRDSEDVPSEISLEDRERFMSLMPQREENDEDMSTLTFFTHDPETRRVFTEQIVKMSLISKEGRLKIKKTGLEYKILVTDLILDHASSGMLDEDIVRLNTDRQQFLEELEQVNAELAKLHSPEVDVFPS